MAHDPLRFAEELSAKLATSSRHVCFLLGAGTSRACGLPDPDAAALDGKVCAHIVEALDLTAADLDPMRGLAAWVGRARYRLPVEIFTVNYDLLIETVLEES